MTTLVALGTIVTIGLGGRQAPHSPAAGVTPQACVKAGRDFAAKRQNEFEKLTSDAIRQIDAERIEIVRRCAASLDIERGSADDLAALVELYTEAQQPDLAERVIERGLTATMTPANRAAFLDQAVRFLLRQPKSDARNARVESYTSALDALPDDYLDQKLTAHAALNSYYRGNGTDAGIMRHSTWILQTAPRLTPEQRNRFAFALIAAYTYQAAVLAGQGENDRALDLLTRAPKELSDIPGVERRVSPDLARYRLVGTRAAPIQAPVWLNASEGTRTLDMDGAVTLLQFAAHWCEPCRESHPGIQRLRTRFSGRPFRVIFVTQLYGYFEKERDLPAELEIERDRRYFRDLGLDVPVAITPRADDAAASNGPDNEAAYHVNVIPQINIIDAHGRIRLIMIGYDDADEPKLVDFIEKLLSEK